MIYLEDENNRKDTELEDLKRKVEEKKEELNDFKKYKGEEMIVKIQSMDQEIDYAIPCYSEDPFYIVEEKLYEKFERYREKNNIFLYGGRAILRYKSIKENKIDDSMPILLPDLTNQSNYMLNNSFCLFSYDNGRNNNNENYQINENNNNMNNNENNNFVASLMDYLNSLINSNIGNDNNQNHMNIPLRNNQDNNN